MNNSSQPSNDQVPSFARGDRLVYFLPEQGMSIAPRDEMDIFALWDIIWADKWLIAAIVSVFLAGSVAYALLATEWYEANVVLAPAADEPVQDLMGSLGGLASLAGLNVRGTGSATVEALAVLKSRSFTREFIEQEGLLTHLFADEWDAQARRWRHAEQGEVPDIRDAVKLFDESIRFVDEDPETGLVTLSVRWTDPQIAADWANRLVDRLNARMRQRAQVEAQKNVDYLRQELIDNGLVTIQTSVGRLLETELQKLMLARGREEFSFHVIDRAEPPKYRSSPKRTLIVIFAGVLGGFLSVLIALMRHAVRTRARQDTARAAA